MKDFKNLNGVLLFDKPLGFSSQQALSKVKRLLGAAKAGHTGTLDPLATGLLPLCFGEATKFSQGLLNADKTYEADIFLGCTTTTGDAEGEVLQQMPVTVTVDQLRAALLAFMGEIEQLPPMYSALKKDGKPLYAYARSGQNVERESRRVIIYQLDLLEFQMHSPYPVVRVRVVCSKGTYIRTLAEDIGQQLGCGAHLKALRRTAIADLHIAQAVTMDDLEKLVLHERVNKLAPVDSLIQDLPKIDLFPELAVRFSQGQRLSGLFAQEGLHRVYCADKLLGTALFDGGILRPQRLLQQSV